MDTNTRSFRIAQAADKSLREGPAVLDEALAGATPEEIAEAYEHALNAGITHSAATGYSLQTRLRVRLMREHVASQQKIAEGQDKLSGRILFLNVLLVVLTAALVLFAVPDGISKARSLISEHQDAAAWEAWARARPNADAERTPR
jgi:hypothetical protein